MVGIYSFSRKMTVQVSNLDEDSDEVNDRKASEEANKLKSFARLTSRVKIGIATYQIVLQSPGSLRIHWGPAFTQFINSMSFLNFDFVKILPIQCYSEFNYIASMEAATLVPILITGLVVCIYLANSISLHITLRQRQDEEQLQLAIKKLRVRFFSFFVMMSYLVLPGEAVKIIRMFSCMDVDPNHEAPDQMPHKYLIVDMNVDCNSEAYMKGREFAVLMLFVYPIGLPLMYLALLNFCKEKIKHRQDQDKKTLNLLNAVSIVDGISFLFESYDPKYWYWEFIECTRRLLLTAAISFFQPGSSTQMVVAMTLALIYVSLYAHYQPYLSRSDNVLSELGQWQIFITFFCALLISK